MADVRDIVGRLSEAQRRYLRAVEASAEPYQPRHGVTANWALRHGYVDTIVRRPDGSLAPWDQVDAGVRFECEPLGQRLTPLGRALLSEEQK